MKRKFKITLIAISILSILFAFTITSSASNYIDISSVTMEGLNGGMFVSYSNFDYDFSSTAGEEFGVVTFDHSGGSSLGFVNIEFWDSYMTSKNVESSEDFLSAVREMVDIGYLSEYSDILSMVAMSPSSFYNVYSSYKAQQLNQFSHDDLQAKYDEGYAQGEIDGLTEYKSSEEYTTALNNKYSIGYTEGIESFKASDEYFTALYNASVNGVTEYKNSKEYATILDEKYLSGYSQGSVEGVTLYKASDEYANILQGKFDEGYDFASDDASGVDWLGLAFGAFGIFVIFLVFFVGIKSSKKKKSRY